MPLTSSTAAGRPAVDASAPTGTRTATALAVADPTRGAGTPSTVTVTAGTGTGTGAGGVGLEVVASAPAGTRLLPSSVMVWPGRALPGSTRAICGVAAAMALFPT